MTGMGKVGLSVILGALLLATATIAATAMMNDSYQSAVEGPSSIAANPTNADVDFSGVADKLRELGGSQFAGVEIREEQKTIVAYWVGDVPSSVREYGASHPEGITIKLRTTARFSHAKLRDAAERVTNSPLGRRAGIASISAKHDGSGLGIDLEGELPNASTQAEIADLAGLPANSIKYTPNNGLEPL